MIRGIIYTRVSSIRQEVEGHGLDSQYAICIQFAERKGISVEHHFSDTWTGRRNDRQGLSGMLSHVRRHRSMQWVIIFDDISRFARDLRDHLELREKLRAAGCLVMTPSREFKDDPDSILVENILASMAQHSSMKNRETVLSRMQGCLYSGRWPFRTPYGYTRSSQKEGSEVIKLEPHFSIVSEVFKRFATGSLGNQSAVMDFLAGQPAYCEYHRHAKPTVVRAHRILTNIFYAGYIEYPKWGVKLLKANHEAAVDYHTFTEIQEILKAGRRVEFTSRATDFPARGLVCCADCNGHLTAGWSKGKQRRYAYYSCYNRACIAYRKSIPRVDIENGISALLTGLKPSEGALETFGKFLAEAGEGQLRSSDFRRKELRSAIASSDKQEGLLIDRLLEVSEKRIIDRLQERVVALGREREIMKVKLEQAEKRCQVQRVEFEHLRRVLINPCDTWENGSIKQKRTVI